MNISTINWAAVTVAALSNFLIGGLWYSPILFVKQWQKENKISEEELKKRNMPKILGLSFLFSFIMAFNLSLFLNDSKTTMTWGAIAGLLAGLGWAAMAFCIIGQFEKRSTRYMLIHSGYITLSFTIMGLIIGAWR